MFARLCGIVFSAVVMLALAGCSGKFDCGTRGKCANDPGPSQAQIDSCNKEEGGACGAEISDVALCAYNHEQCTTDGTADLSGSLAACQPQNDALASCCKKSPGAPGCPVKFDCGTMGKCANDPGPSQAQIDSCNKEEGGACGTEISDVAQCAYDHEQCNADGTADLSGSQAACQPQNDALASCCKKSPGAPGCPAKFACGTKGKCSGDQPPTQAEINNCNTEENGACGTQLSDVAQCAYDNEKCNADGSADLTSLQTTCSTQVSALTTCCQKNPSAPGCTGA